ncbi:MAG: protein kinase [Myxococcota bacterium]
MKELTSVAEAAGLAPGGQVGNYTLVQKLRDGGMASLYLAKRSGVHGFTRPVAIKVVHAHLSGQSEFVQMFVDEAILSSHLNHPNIVHVEEFGELDDGRCFLAMEYIDGCSLSELSRHQRKQSGPGDVNLVTHMGIKIADALHAAHEAVDASGELLGVVHRDVSPGNILLSRRGHVKVVDFGIAKSSIRADHTVESLKGKIRYMSPEQARGKLLDARTDVYSLALVIWELLAGRRVFNSKRDLALLDEVREPKIDPVSKFNEDVPESLDEVLLKALSKEPEDRYTTAKEFSRALRDAHPEARNVDASDLAKLVATVPQRNIDRTTMTGSGSTTLTGHTPSGTGDSLLGSASGRRRIATDGEGTGNKALGVPSEFPVSVDVPEGGLSAERKLQVGIAVGAVLIALIVAVAWPSSEPEASAEPTTAPTQTTTMAAPPVPADPGPTPMAEVEPTPMDPEVAPTSAPAPEAAPQGETRRRRRWVRGRGSMVQTPATPEPEVAAEPDEPATSMRDRRVGMTLLAGDADDGPIAPRRPRRESETRNAGGTLLADPD